MRIQLGMIYMNKTKKYLLPCLREYGDEFTDRVRSLFKLAIGIGDTALLDMGISLEKDIFILIDTKMSRKKFKSTLEWLRLQDYYSFDYPFDDLHNGHLHMLVVKVPKNYYDSFGRFKESQFSKMYSYKDLEKFFKGRDEEIRVLSRDKNYMVQFVDKVNQIYLTAVDPTEWIGELDFPIQIEEEIF